MSDDKNSLPIGKPPKSASQMAPVLDTIRQAAQPQTEGPWDGQLVRRLLARTRRPFQLNAGQTSILAILTITTIAACWFATLRASPGIGCLTITAPSLLIVAIYLRSAWPFFWLPLTVSFSLIVSLFLALPIPGIASSVTLALACLASTVCLALQGTRYLYRNSTSPGGAVLTTLGLCTLGGTVSVLMVLAPLWLARFGFLTPPLLFSEAVGFSFLFLGFLGGLILGIPLAFVGDALVAYDARKRAMRY